MAENVEMLDPYQIEGAQFLADHERAGLYDEPGLGKTAQLIRARQLVGAEKTLIICPAGVKSVYPQQFRLWDQTGARVVRANDRRSIKYWHDGRFPVLVASWDQARQWHKDFAADFIDLVAMDESHYAKSPSAMRSRAVMGAQFDGNGGIAGLAERAWMLSGTPIKNTLPDIWTQARFARATTLTHQAFTNRYMEIVATPNGPRMRPRRDRLQELREMLRSYSILRTFDDVGHQLPPMRMVTLPINGDDRELVAYLTKYPGLSSEIVDALRTEGKLSFDQGQHIATLRRLIAEAKVPGYARMVTEELETDIIDKLVVMANHRAAIELLTKHLRKHGIRAEAITGSTSDRERGKIVQSFQEDPAGVRVIVGNIQAAGTGLTMTAANRIDMLESPWTPADATQAIRRVRRRGQTRTTFARFIALENSFDERVTDIIVRKANEIAMVTEKDNLREASPRLYNANAA